MEIRQLALERSRHTTGRYLRWKRALRERVYGPLVPALQISGSSGAEDDPKGAKER